MAEKITLSPFYVLGKVSGHCVKNANRVGNTCLDFLNSEKLMSSPNSENSDKDSASGESKDFRLQMGHGNMGVTDRELNSDKLIIKDAKALENEEN